MYHQSMREWTIFTDGACSGNPGPGGWGAIVLNADGEVRELGGRQADTTNNRMELSAAIAALGVGAPHKPESLNLYADSSYVILGITKWLAGWKRKGWMSSTGTPVLNRDLWEKLDELVSKIGAGRIHWHYVRGHSGSPGNERCDAIAVSFAQGRPLALYRGALSAYDHDLADIPADTAVPRNTGPSKKQKGGFYLSLVNGKLERHEQWSECQARVSGKSGARFKKVQSRQEETETLKSWGVWQPSS